LIRSTRLGSGSLAPWNRVIVGQIAFLRPVKLFHAVYGTLRFIALFIRPTTLDLALGQINPVHSLVPYFFAGYTSSFGL
jgi:hypothetical protein